MQCHTEFVKYHLQKFSAVDDGLFVSMIGALMEKAENEVVIDDKPAIAGQANEPEPEPEPEAPAPPLEAPPAEPEPEAEPTPAEQEQEA